MKTPGAPDLLIQVTVLELPIPSYVYAIQVASRQGVYLARDLDIYGVGTTWSAPGYIGIAPKERLETVVRDSIKDQVDRFINAWLSVNPK